MKISAIVLARNEEKNIVDCLDSLSFVDEVIVVDDNSTDRTPELVKSLSLENKKIKIFQRSLENNFSLQRKFGIDKAKNDWILFLDSDERVSKELASEIEGLEDEIDEFGGFLIKRTDFIWGKALKHGETGNIKLLRLFNKRKGELKGKVHETWVTKSKVVNLTHPILHYPHPTISGFLKEINFYTDLRAAELYSQGAKTGFFRIILYSKGKFILNYFLKLGFLDGVEGLVHAFLMSFHSFMVRGKLWLLWQKEKAS